MHYEEYEENKRSCHKTFALKNETSLAFPIHSNKIYFILSLPLSQPVTFATFSLALGNKKFVSGSFFPLKSASDATIDNHFKFPLSRQKKIQDGEHDVVLRKYQV